MSRKEVPRAGLVKAALAGRISNCQVATALQLSVRQVQRLKRRFREGGARALLHRNRGQPSLRRLPAELRHQVAMLLQSTYAGFNDCHLTEKLQDGHQLRVSRVSVRRIRRALGLPAKHRRRAPPPVRLPAQLLPICRAVSNTQQTGCRTFPHGQLSRPEDD